MYLSSGQRNTQVKRVRCEPLEFVELTYVVCVIAADILKINDDLSRVMEEYRKKFGTPDPVTDRPSPSLPTPVSSHAPVSGEAGSSLIDLGINQPSNEAVTQNSDAASSVLENELKALGEKPSNPDTN